jgi:hypothetical protein
VSDDERCRVRPSLGFATRSACPHTIRCNTDPAWCSQCLGVTAARSIHVFRAEGFEVDQGVIDHLVDTSNRERHTPRANTRRTSAPISDKECAARQARARAAATARWNRNMTPVRSRSDGANRDR